MKRHYQLVPLSRQHHQQLLLSRLLREDAPSYKGLPTNKFDKLSYALNMFETQILPHFELENQLFDKLGLHNIEELTPILEKQRNYQFEIIKIFNQLSEDTLDKAGRMLEESIRHEERVFFECIQIHINLDKVVL